MPSLRVGFIGGLVGVGLGILGTLTTTPRGSTSVDSTTGISSLSQHHVVDDAGASYPGVITIHDEEKGTSPLPRITTSTSISGEQTGGDDRSTAEHSGGDVTDATEIATSAPVAGVSGVHPLLSSMGGDAIIHSDIAQGAIHLLENSPIWLRILLLLLVLSPLVLWHHIERLLRPVTAPVLLLARSWLPAGLYSTLSNFSLVSLLWYNLGPLIDLAVAWLLPGYSGPSDIVPKTLTALAAVLIVYFRTGRQDDVISQLMRERDDFRLEAQEAQMRGVKAKVGMNRVKQASGQIKQLQQALGRKRQSQYQTKFECRAAEDRTGLYLARIDTLLNALCLHNVAFRAFPGVLRAAEQAQAVVGMKLVMPHGGPFGSKTKIYTISPMKWPEELPYNEETLVPGLRAANFKLNKKVLSAKKQLTAVGLHMADQEDGHTEELKKKDNQISLLRKGASKHTDELNEMVDTLDKAQEDLQATEQKVEEHLDTIEQLQGKLDNSNAENTRLEKKITNLKYWQLQGKTSHKTTNERLSACQQARDKYRRETNKKIYDLKAELKDKEIELETATKHPKPAAKPPMKCADTQTDGDVVARVPMVNGSYQTGPVAQVQKSPTTDKATETESRQQKLIPTTDMSTQTDGDPKPQSEMFTAAEFGDLMQENANLKEEMSQQSIDAEGKVLSEEWKAEDLEKLKEYEEIREYICDSYEYSLEMVETTKKELSELGLEAFTYDALDDFADSTIDKLKSFINAMGQELGIREKAWKKQKDTIKMLGKQFDRLKGKAPASPIFPGFDPTKFGTTTKGSGDPLQIGWGGKSSGGKSGGGENYTEALAGPRSTDILPSTTAEDVVKIGGDDAAEADDGYGANEQIGELDAASSDLASEDGIDDVAMTDSNQALKPDNGDGESAQSSPPASVSDDATPEDSKKDAAMTDGDQSAEPGIGSGESAQSSPPGRIIAKATRAYRGGAKRSTSTASTSTESNSVTPPAKPTARPFWGGGNSANEQTGPPLPKSSEYGRGFRNNTEEPVDRPVNASNDIMAGRKVAKPKGAKRAMSAQDIADRKLARDNYYFVVLGIFDELDGMDEDRVRRIQQWAKEKEDEEDELRACDEGLN
ncbi:hypothetical protein LTR37_000266 [Vermiconidia calcicola]|uniref:Uncharacterized protein n=1 Tax=Vermiconidia calcicola TaxID=1690605 RepID=A0ACC3P0Y9_9PEZI|nr:hypothetical protein LTR37_000266 [Vermiconidia calcicola]